MKYGDKNKSEEACEDALQQIEIILVYVVPFKDKFEFNGRWCYYEQNGRKYNNCISLFS